MATLCFALAGPASAAAQPFQTALMDYETFTGPDAASGFAAVRAAGATIVRLQVYWGSVAPGGSTRPSFDAANPADPAYDWTVVDRQVTLAASAGLAPVLSVAAPPTWAQSGAPGGAENPSPTELAAFAHAIATRYGGGFAGLPRVRYWGAWNEPNWGAFLEPQYSGPTLVSPAVYRGLLNAFYDAVKGVHPDNVVLAGELDPFTGGAASSPIDFMRGLLCVTATAKPKATCRTSAKFDVWAEHPYTAGAPSHPSAPGNASLNDLPLVHRMVDAAARAGNVVHSGRLQFWVTEFSWDSNPPDPAGVPERLLARWVAEAFYRMWHSGVSVITWFTLRDYPADFQSGLYFRGASVGADRPKATLAVFKFPFAAVPAPGRRVRVWGRTPAGKPARVSIEQRVRGRWRRVVKLRANGFGIFTKVVRTGRAPMRARLGATRSVPFTPRRTPDRRLPNPFGS